MTDSSTSTEEKTVSAAPPVPWECLERFVGQLTHDVRNGLNALELQLTFLGEISTDKEAIEEVKQLRRTLGDVTRQLQAVKAATGPASPQLLDYPAGELFEDLRERFERQQPESASKFEWKIELSDAVVAVDPELTMTALLEVLNNAIRFGGESLSANFSAQADLDAGTATATLHERKPAQTMPISTERWGLEPLRSTRRGGYGLGLFRARRAIEAQGGTLTAQYLSSDHLLITSVKLPLGAGR